VSRIGKLPIKLPKGVTVKVEENAINVKGPKGELTVPFKEMTVSVENDEIKIVRSCDERDVRALHGLYRSLIANAVKGVSEGFKKEMEIVGMGWRCEMKGTTLVMYLGYSHPVEVEPPKGIKFSCPDKNKITVEGFDKELVGQTAANLREWRVPEPYKGKGVRYVGEYVRSKAGKAGAKK